MEPGHRTRTTFEIQAKMAICIPRNIFLRPTHLHICIKVTSLAVLNFILLIETYIFLCNQANICFDINTLDVLLYKKLIPWRYDIDIALLYWYYHGVLAFNLKPKIELEARWFQKFCQANIGSSSLGFKAKPRRRQYDICSYLDIIQI